MALNDSGPLSLGGSIVGQSVNLELGLPATNSINLNETNVRDLADRPRGAISMFDFYGKSAATDIVMDLYLDNYISTRSNYIDCYVNGVLYQVGSQGSGFFQVTVPANSPIDFTIFAGDNDFRQSIVALEAFNEQDFFEQSTGQYFAELNFTYPGSSSNFIFNVIAY